MASDTLIAKRLNLFDGGTKVQNIRSGWYENDGNIVEQDIQYEGSSKHSVDGRIQKWIQRILKERGLWPDFGLSLNDDRNLKPQPDLSVQ